jgi:hypothetical protein
VWCVLSACSMLRGWQGSAACADSGGGSGVWQGAAVAALWGDREGADYRSDMPCARKGVHLTWHRIHWVIRLEKHITDNHARIMLYC